MTYAKIQSQGAAGYVKQSRGKFWVSYIEIDKDWDNDQYLEFCTKELAWILTYRWYPRWEDMKPGTTRARFTFYKLCPMQRERWMEEL